MKLRNNITKIGSKILIAALAVLLLSGGAMGIEHIDTSRTGSLTIDCQNDSKAVVGMVFSLYRVAKVGDDGQFALLPAYQKSGVTLRDDDTTSQWKTDAATLAKWVSDNKLSSTATKTTDSNGKATYTPAKTGLYLAVGKDTKIGEKTYQSTPFLVSVPGQNADGTQWNYAVTAKPKTSATPNTSNKPGKPGNPHLPRTGQLKWPIPILAAVGLMLMIAGWRIKRRQQHE